ncbi:hypothetical protein BT69DRAFT_1290916, partial [Atractiella rhizophila]
MAKDVIACTPNVRQVWMDAIWNEDDAKILLHAIEGLRRMQDVTFQEEVENFMERTSGRIRYFFASDVEDSASST